MKVLALTFGGEDAASTKFRILQYREYLAAEGIFFDHVPAKGFNEFRSLPDYDAVLLQKSLVSGRVLNKLRKGAKRLLYDADDLIWLAPKKKHSFFSRIRIETRLRRIARSADTCVAANGVIAADLAARGGKTAVVPMALDGRIWQDPNKEPGLNVGWSGAPGNLPFVREILPQLRELQRRFPEVRWLFHCGEDPRFSDFRYIHLPFEPGREQEAVRRFHIGLLPLPEDPFVRGKSPIKALQYFASRVAVVGSPVGATRELLRDGENSLWVNRREEWVTVLERVISDEGLRSRLAAAGRKSFEEGHDLPKVAGGVIRVLRGEEVEH